MTARTKLSTLAALAVLVASCTMKNQEAPPLTGPSEFATSIAVSVSPDILATNGAQSVVTVQAFDANGQPLRNLRLRAEIRVNGTPVDFGTLSQRDIFTDAAGRATVVYTAPMIASGEDEGITVDIAVTPVGNSFGDNVARTATIRLVPPGVVIPPNQLDPYFTFTPNAPSDNQAVLFTACGQANRSCGAVTSYVWNFGDNTTATGSTVSHAYAQPGTYIVRLTVTDAFGRSASASQSITVSASASPTSNFTISPTDPVINQPVQFNGSSSVAPPGRTIVSYKWDYGDPFSPNNSDQGVQVAHAYSRVGTYTVTLVVTDSAGRTATSSKTVQVK